MDGQQYKMPDKRMDGALNAHGAPKKPGVPGNARAKPKDEALKAHYGAENIGRAALSDIQPLTEEQRRHVDHMYQLYDEFEQYLRPEHDKIDACRQIYELNDPQAGANEPQLPIILSTIENKIADQLDNMPEAVLTPESPQMQQYAEDATDMVRWVFERNDIDIMYQQLAEDFYVVGSAIMQIHWDEDMDGGQGGIKIMRVPIDGMVWDPTAKSIQSCRAIFKTAFHPRGWYEEHYPEVGMYVQPDSYRDPRRDTLSRDQDVMMLECWWREYDAEQERYKVHVTHMAGRVLLYDSRDDFPEGIYAHGEYPFAMCSYREAIGSLRGRSCVEDYVELNRYANRNAKYIDWATRFAARPKLILGQGLELRDETEITDSSKQIVHVDGMVTGSNLTWMPTPAVPAMAYNMQQWYIDTLKQESGQNQFSRGEGGMGVTAASAIQSLQEAGAKSSRMEAQRLSGMYRDAVNQVLWLIAQFFDPPRIIMITGNLQSPYIAKPLIAGRQQMTNSPDLHPSYRVNLQIRRRNPLRVESENEMILKIYEMSANAGNPLPLSTVLELLQVDGKERILPRVREVQQQQEQTAAALEVAQAAQQEAANAKQQLENVKTNLVSQAKDSISIDPTQAVYGGTNTSST